MFGRYRISKNCFSTRTAGALLTNSMRAVVGVLRGAGQALDKLGRAFEVAPFVEACKYSFNFYCHWFMTGLCMLGLTYFSSFLIECSVICIFAFFFAKKLLRSSFA